MMSVSMPTLRAHALVRFNELGVPTTKHEEWKYTRLAGITSRITERITERITSENPSSGIPLRESLSENTSLRIPLLESLSQNPAQLTILNGTYRPDLSTLTDVEGLTIRELNDDVVASDEKVGAAFTTAAPIGAHAFVALNTALATSGVVITVAKNATIHSPLTITCVNDAQTENVLTTPRVLVIAEEGASVQVIESHHAQGEHTAVEVGVTEIIAHANSSVTYVKLLVDVGNTHHIGFTGGHIYRDAVIRAHTFCIDGTFTRNDLELKLMEPGASAYLDGVSVLNEEQFADNHTVVDHLVPHCHSEELYKGVYDGKSTGVFNGKIFVRPQAQKTTAYQSNHSLLLSDRASVNAKPQLEIFADDVKCSHGATMGQLDEEAVFYLQARGIGRDEARALMTYAFAAEVIERLPFDDLRTYLEERVATKLGAQP